MLIPPQAKKDVLFQLFSNRISEGTLYFLYLVMDKRRADHLEVMFVEYQAMADESRNIVKAEVTSAKHVDGQDIAKLKRPFQQQPASWFVPS